MDKIVKKNKKKKRNFFKSVLNKFRDKSPKVNILKLSGVISDTGLVKKGLNIESLQDDIKRAFTCGKPKAVAIVINSPGGSPVQSEYIFKYIRRMSEEMKVPVYSFAEDVAASGGYFLACAGDEFYVSGSTLTGSIGVISRSFGFVGIMEKLGVERRIYKEGENKALLDMFSPENKATGEIMRSILKDVHGNFKAIVIDRRKGKIREEDYNHLFSGEFWSGNRAVELGLADGIDDVWNFMTKKFGKKVKFNTMNKPKGWLRRKFSSWSPNAIVEEIAMKITEREYFSRFGL